jgi:hypothetical protein
VERQAAVTQVGEVTARERQAAIAQIAEVTARERQAAIEQASRAVASEREAMFKGLDEREGRVRALLGDVKGILDQADRVAASVNTSTANTVTTTGHTAEGAMTHALVMGLIFLAALLLGVPLALLGYRGACRRLLGPPAAARDIGAGTGPAAGAPSNGSADAATVDRKRVPL